MLRSPTCKCKRRNASRSICSWSSILAIACWCLPIDRPLVTFLNDQTRSYFRWSGLFQGWNMFSPLPKSANTYVEATIVRQDGTKTTWISSDEQLSFTQRLFKERYRKFGEHLAREENHGLLPDVARHIARLNSTPSNPAKTVILIQKWSFIVPRPDGSFVPEPWDQHVLLGYGVKPEDLK